MSAPFAQEFIAEIMREPRARKAHLAERARWLRQLEVGGREEVLFELELLLRALERAFERRHAPGGTAPFGRDFADDLRAARNALHRAELLARRLTNPDVERGFHFRGYLERLHAEARVPRLTRELIAQRTPEESLYLLRQSLHSLQRLADQLLRLPFVSFACYGDFAALAEQSLLSSRYFRPPSVLEFRSEYDRVGSVHLLELARGVEDERARKALVLAFLASFRLLRQLRFVPATPVALPRRALLVLRLARDEAITIANYVENDLPRLVATSQSASVLAPAGAVAAELLRSAVHRADSAFVKTPLDRDSIEFAREALSEGAKAATAKLAESLDPTTSSAALFDGARVRRERALRLRSELWIFGQLLRSAMEELFPAMKGEPVRAFGHLDRLVRFCDRFRQVGYHLLRRGDHEPFDRFFESIRSLTGAPRSATRDRRLYLDCRRFLLMVERSLALVNRRAELVDLPIDTDAVTAELESFREASANQPIDEALLERLSMTGQTDSMDASTTGSPEELTPSLVDVESGGEFLATGDELDPVGPVEQSGVLEAARTIEELESIDIDDPGDLADSAPDDDEGEDFQPELTRRIWRG